MHSILKHFDFSHVFNFWHYAVFIPQIWMDRLFRSPEKGSSTSRLLDLRFVNFFFSLREIVSVWYFRRGFILSIKREPEISSNNYFSLQRGDRFFFYTFSFLFVDALPLWRRRNIFLHRGLIFQVRRNAAGSLKSPVLFFLVRLPHKKAPR